MTLAIVVFLCGVIVYGIILNLREIPLSEALTQKGFSELKNPNIVIDRVSFTLNLYEDSVLVKTYRASFGRTLHKPKSRAGDGATPVGRYQVCSIDTSYKYYKFFRLNYPSIDDATDALKKGLISQKEFNNIKFEYYYEGCTGYNIVLGGNIGIHGFGKFNYVLKNLPFVFNWTDGSIALSDEDIEEIYSVIKIGTKVVIK
ncbi:MAG: L,D-transpeptidase [Ignavibacteriae bacterium]|nr:MAG: L,D-transpeptidase [Ignavibacteriota bacterium]